MPERGVLSAHLSGYWNPCSENKAYSLRSGLVLTRIDCWQRGEARVIRYRVRSRSTREPCSKRRSSLRSRRSSEEPGVPAELRRSSRALGRGQVRFRCWTRQVERRDRASLRTPRRPRRRAERSTLRAPRDRARTALHRSAVAQAWTTRALRPARHLATRTSSPSSSGTWRNRKRTWIRRSRASLVRGDRY